jgi:glycopeptide antibiotics resistance protein
MEFIKTLRFDLPTLYKVKVYRVCLYVYVYCIICICVLKSILVTNAFKGMLTLNPCSHTMSF